MSERDSKLPAMVEIAAGIVAGSKNFVGIRKAMDIAGFTEEETKLMRLYQQVRRRSLNLFVVDATSNTTPPPPEAIALLALAASGTSSLTSSSRIMSAGTSTSTSTTLQEEVSTSANAESSNRVRR